nr:ethylene-responsive transcription factor ERF061-like [Ipomoea trifida]
MESIHGSNMPFVYGKNTEIRSSLSQLILNGGANTMDSIFSCCPEQNQTAANHHNSASEPLGSSVYLLHRDILQKFCQENRKAVDAKIHAISQKVKRESKSKESKSKRRNSVNSANSAQTVRIESPSSSPFAGNQMWGNDAVSTSVSGEEMCNCNSKTSTSSDSGGIPAVPSIDSEFDDCGLARIPSFDLELIWEVLAN